MDLPELINCSDDDDEGEFVDYCYNTLDSYASTLSIHTLNDYNAVSYTHLDVYKRQVILYLG